MYIIFIFFQNKLRRHYIPVNGYNNAHGPENKGEPYKIPLYGLVVPDHDAYHTQYDTDLKEELSQFKFLGGIIILPG